MALREEWAKTGNWLFTYRSFLPLILYVFLVIVLFLNRRDDFLVFDNILWCSICLGISLFGLFIRALTIGVTPAGTSGRNTQQQIADVLNTKGIYATVRHPLYLGNYFMWLGLLLYTGIWWFVLIVSLVFWLYYERIMFAEEEFLRHKFGNDYLQWANNTPAFIPKLSQWQTSELPFSLRNVLKREYNGLFNTAISFLLINALKNYFNQQQFYINIIWIDFFIVATLALIVLRTLKKKTTVLDVKGR